MVSQDVGRIARDDTVPDLNQLDLEEKDGSGEVEGSVEDEEADEELPKDSHDDVRDMEPELEVDVVEGAGDVGEEAIEQARQVRNLRRWAFCLPFLFLRSS